MKYSGAIVMLLGLGMLYRSLANFGFNPSIFYLSPEIVQEANQQKFQEVHMSVNIYGYQPNIFYVKRGIPVKWIIDGSGITGCTNEIILHGDYNIRKKLIKGENIVEFTPGEIGEIKFSCWMQMVWGKFIVTDKDDKPSSESGSPDIINGANASAEQATTQEQAAAGTKAAGADIDHYNFH